MTIWVNFLGSYLTFFDKRLLLEIYVYMFTYSFH